MQAALGTSGGWEGELHPTPRMSPPPLCLGFPQPRAGAATPGLCRESQRFFNNTAACGWPQARHASEGRRARRRLKGHLCGPARMSVFLFQPEGWLPRARRSTLSAHLWQDAQTAHVTTSRKSGALGFGGMQRGRGTLKGGLINRSPRLPGRAHVGQEGWPGGGGESPQPPRGSQAAHTAGLRLT